MEAKFGRGYMYSLQYHIVWCVKYRKKILTADRTAFLESVLRRTAAENGIGILELNIGDGDHVHMLVDCTPQHLIPSIVKSFKGTSARWLYRQFPELRQELWGGNIWNPSYFVSTVSENTEDQVRRYIQSQDDTEPTGESGENE
ncbi:MAG: IS200/IS605 family transposase [Anaerovoracaceae bacterium]